MKFFVIRHPQTQWNLANILQGQMDSPLTDFGIETANALAIRLKDRGITKIIASDLGRCIETAGIVNGVLGLPIQTSEQLREQHFGIWGGKDKVYARGHMNLNNPDYVPEGGESAQQMKQRVMEFIGSQLEEFPDESILFVAHDGTLRAILSEVYDCALMDPRCKTTQSSIYAFEFSEGNYALHAVI